MTLEPGRLKIYENGEWRYVGYGPLSTVATNLSDVIINDNKDWNAKNITNVGTVDGVDISAVAANDLVHIWGSSTTSKPLVGTACENTFSGHLLSKS